MFWVLPSIRNVLQKDSALRNTAAERSTIPFIWVKVYLHPLNKMSLIYSLICYFVYFWGCSMSQNPSDNLICTWPQQVLWWHYRALQKLQCTTVSFERPSEGKWVVGFKYLQLHTKNLPHGRIFGMIFSQYENWR